MHIEDQVDRLALLQHADEQDARKKGLARAALAEDAVGALDELLQVEAELGLHVQRVADEKSLGVLGAEDQLHVPLRSQVDHGEVAGHGLDGLGSFEQAVGIAADDQGGGNVKRAEGAGARQDLGDKGVGDVGWGEGKPLVGHSQADLAYHAEEAPFCPLDGDEAPHRHILDGSRAIQLDLDSFTQ
ncbi:hypothetical protein ES708_08569 [subsurface metagenome]